MSIVLNLVHVFFSLLLTLSMYHLSSRHRYMGMPFPPFLFHSSLTVTSTNLLSDFYQPINILNTKIGFHDSSDSSLYYFEKALFEHQFICLKGRERMFVNKNEFLLIHLQCAHFLKYDSSRDLDFFKYSTWIRKIN